MISFYNTSGKVNMTGNYFAQLVSAAAQSGYGVAEMAASSPSDSLKAFIQKDYPNKGVLVLEEDGKLLIQLHIKVTYGLNIAVVVKSISHKVRYVVEEATGLTVKRVRVSVDDVVV